MSVSGSGSRRVSTAYVRSPPCVSGTKQSSLLAQFIFIRRVPTSLPARLSNAIPCPTAERRLGTCAGTTESVSTKQPAELVATIPERYCGVSVKSQGGNITLPGLTETYLDIRTDGDGDVNVGKIKANSVAITTQRGSITGSITATGSILSTFSSVLPVCGFAGGSSVSLLRLCP